MTIKKRKSSPKTPITGSDRYFTKEKTDHKKEEKISNLSTNFLKEAEFFDKARRMGVKIVALPFTMSLYYPKYGTHSTFFCDEKTLGSYKLFQLNKLLGEIEG